VQILPELTVGLISHVDVIANHDRIEPFDEGRKSVEVVQMRAAGIAKRHVHAVGDRGEGSLEVQQAVLPPRHLPHELVDRHFQEVDVVPVSQNRIVQVRLVAEAGAQER